MKKAAEPRRDGEDLVDFDFGPDGRLLSHLVQDGRASFEDLARHAGLSRQTAWRKVQGLEGGVLWGVTAIVDHRKLGWREYVITIPGSPDFDVIRKVEEAQEASARWGTLRVLQSHLVRGTAWRMVIHVAVQSALVLEAFLQLLSARFPGAAAPVIEEVEHVLYEHGFTNPATDALKPLKAKGGVA